MEPIIVISVISALILLMLFIGAPMKPLQVIGQGLIKIMIGALFLFFLNSFGTYFGLHVPINIVTSIISGFLGIPGVAALAVIQLFILY
ncbi:pro-sigmaK processing inhibitor BofA [Bacillus sp. HMF5848]|uniref:pro-sigmaK processing inhibitor BofA family protein n=1 Tax=Bacillus sp. HMF5848 TaxID=2495421 RepID=UPI000F7A6B66|nr:pro-sigmaK processing inhibitor BofA family protein [Bacillus sp. HMF5848]RSK25458.1 pro-sigmaK processing inhibitor BofA [Bacillus sp. HMF5848]